MSDNPYVKLVRRLGILCVLAFAIALFAKSSPVLAATLDQCDACVQPCDDMERECDAELLADPNFDYNDCILQASECLNNCLCVCSRC